jgi:hypothetical protein
MYKDTQGCRLTLGYKAPQYVYGEMEKIEGYYSLFSHSKKPSKQSCFLRFRKWTWKASFVSSFYV